MSIRKLEPNSSGNRLARMFAAEPIANDVGRLAAVVTPFGKRSAVGTFRPRLAAEVARQLESKPEKESRRSSVT